MTQININIQKILGVYPAKGTIKELNYTESGIKTLSKKIEQAISETKKDCYGEMREMIEKDLMMYSCACAGILNKHLDQLNQSLNEKDKL